jgi:hypothetical protein
MTQQGLLPPVAAVVFKHRDDVDAILASVVDRMRAKGASLGGQLQFFGDRLANGKRSMWVRDIGTGGTLRIDLPRGAGANGCTLDGDALSTATLNLRATIATMPELLVVNRFGCSEAEGGGMRTEIGEALCAGIPVLIAIRADLLPAWQAFVGEDTTVLPPVYEAVLAWVSLTLGIPEAPVLPVDAVGMSP